jgi:glycosyltransferase involved in cell wall biosynthesis
LSFLKNFPDVFADIDFVFVGMVSRIKHWLQVVTQLGIQNKVRFEGQVGYLESLAIGRQADVLVTLDAPSEGNSVFLPSKLVDYLALDKIILGVTPEQGVSAELLRSLDMPVADPNNPIAICDAIRDLHARWKTGELTFNHLNSEVAKGYKIESTTQQLEDELTRIIVL